MKNSGRIILHLPTFGILVFIGLSIYSTTLYPGGSQADVSTIGFDWLHNFWCNLMEEKAINGQDNPARPVSIFAVVVLCSSMMLFFFLFARYLVQSSFWKILIKVSGVTSMLAAMFIFTKYHDIMTTALSVGGIIGITGIIRTLHKNNLTFFKISGIICIIIIAMNNLFYYVQDLIKFAPLIQKFSFVLMLSWIIGLNLKIKEKAYSGNNK